MNYYLLFITIASVIILAISNRLRGTGVLYHIATISNIKKYTFNKIDNIKINLVGNHLYGLIMSTVAIMLYSSNNNLDYLYLGLSVFILYIAGESKGWGEWVGALTTTKEKNKEWLYKQYIDDEGKGFPFIFNIANFFIKEQVSLDDVSLETAIKQYTRHAILALSLRGLFWWSLTYLPFYIVNIISGFEYLCILLFLSWSFPIACYLGKKTNIKGRLLFFNYSQGWENQELYYGAFNGLVVAYLFLTKLNMI